MKHQFIFIRVRGADGLKICVQKLQKSFEYVNDTT